MLLRLFHKMDEERTLLSLFDKAAVILTQPTQISNEEKIICQFPI